MTQDEVRIGAVVRCPRGHEHTYRPSDSLGGTVYCVEGDCWGDGCQGDSGGGTYYNVSKLTLVKSVLPDLQAENARMREALQQYARPDYYLFLLDPIGQQTDPTAKAKAALA